MEIDVDDFLEYPDDNFIPYDNDGPENRRDETSPPTKRRNFREGEFINRIATLDESMLDSSLDWYLRIDLDNEKARLEADVREKLLDDNIKKIRSAIVSYSRPEGIGSNHEHGFNGDRSRGNILNYPPQRNIHWLPITTPVDRVRLYVTTKPPDDGHRRDDWSVAKRSIGQPLLNKDFGDLLAAAEKLLESKNMKPELSPSNTEIPDSSTVYFTEQMSANTMESTADDMDGMNTDQESNLWVDKYKPKGYIELLSDDGVNRALLTWLKLWDECVFGRKTNTRTVSSLKKEFTGPAVFKERSNFKPGFRNKNVSKTPAVVDADQLPMTLDSHKRPMHKIALLSGPPGAGKTTLAHIVAKHTGYHVQEMNASDDRTLEAFRKQLEGATQMQATLDSGRRPHCLIIDEIDGAPAPSINFLVSLATSSADRSVTTPKQQATKGFILRRPIICICNDLYVPALRELRKIALVLQAPMVEFCRLSERLHQIANKESISLEPGSLELLTTRSGNDVRSCINSLQLLTLTDTADVQTKKKSLTVSRIISADIGCKDVGRSLFSAWQEVFQLPKASKRSARSGMAGSSITERMQNVMTAWQQCSEDDKLVAGLFENYLSVDTDPRLDSVLRGLDWLSIVDRADRLVNETQNYELKRYNCYIAAVFHLIFAKRQFTKLAYPQMITEASFKISKSLAILQSMLSDVKCSINAFLDSRILVLDSLPILLHILQPDLRSGNGDQLRNEQEKSQLRYVASVMADYNLTYRQQRSAQGHFDLVLEPSVDEIVHFPSTNKDKSGDIISSFKSQLSNTVKQMIVHEIELVKSKINEPRQVNKCDQSFRSENNENTV